jgi:hypothetical protein
VGKCWIIPVEPCRLMVQVQTVGLLRGGTLSITLCLLIDDLLKAANPAKLDAFRSSFSIYSTKQVHNFQSIRSNALQSPVHYAHVDYQHSSTMRIRMLGYRERDAQYRTRTGKQCKNTKFHNMHRRTPMGKVESPWTLEDTRRRMGNEDDGSSMSPQIRLRERGLPLCVNSCTTSYAETPTPTSPLTFQYLP